MLGHRALNVEDYLSILKRRWWIIAIPAIIFPILAIGVTYTIPAQYVSQTLVLINQPKVPEDIVKPVVSEDLNSRLASMKEQILSRSSIQPIIEKYNLYASEHIDMDARIDKARKNIDIQPIQSDIARSNGLPGFKIFFTASDPHTAQQVCAEITSLFTSANLSARQADAEGTTSFLKEQLDEAKRTLDDQDSKLAAFQRQYSGLLPEDEANNLNILSGLNSRLDATTQNIQALQQSQSFDQTMLAQQLQQAGPSSSPAQQSPQVQEKQLEALQAKRADLITTYTPDYPEVRDLDRQIDQLQKDMSKSAANPAPAPTAVSEPSRADSPAVQQLRAQLRVIDQAIQGKRKEQDQLQQQIRGYQGRIQSTPEVEQQAKQLTRDHDQALAFYNTLLAQTQRAKEGTDLEQRQQGETFSLLDASNLPDSPTYPNKSVFAVGGLAGGLVLGLMIVALLEYLDTALRNERDVWAFTQLPTLAVIAWSGDMTHEKPRLLARLKRLFSRKAPKKLLADAPG